VSAAEAVRVGLSDGGAEVTDTLGRKLALRPLTALDRLRMFKVLGGDLAQNAAYLGMAMLAWSVTAIDGLPIPSPGSEAPLEALVTKLGDDGLDAVAAVLDAPPGAEELRRDAGN
jgi:hypothetical protein